MKQMHLSGVKAIVFDAVGTLIHPDPPAALVYAAVGADFGCHLTAEVVALKFEVAFQQEDEIDRQAGYRTSEQREYDRWRRIVAQVLDGVADQEACFRVLFDHFSQPRSWRCEKGLDALFLQLRRHGFHLAMASNYDRRLRQVAAGLPPLDMLDPLFISSEAGYRKPAPEFFTLLCQQLALPAQHVLYVGDDPANDYAGAQAAGLHAILFDPNSKSPAVPLRLHCLGDLLKD
jgi:putative hydrolase of the HAD superfamily